MSKVLKCVALELFATLLMLASAFSAFASTDALFSLSDTEVQKGRLFEVTLKAEADTEISSFVCELLYDSQVIAFNSAKVLESDAGYSINTLEEGKVTAVYLCEDGVSCTEETELMTFKFKALEAGSTQIELFVKDAIASDLSDVEASRCVSSRVTVLSAGVTDARSDKNKTAVQKNTDTESDVNTQEASDSFIKGSTDIAGFDISNQTLTALVLSFVCTVLVSLYGAYRLGAKKQSKNQRGVPLDYKDSD